MGINTHTWTAVAQRFHVNTPAWRFAISGERTVQEGDLEIDALIPGGAAARAGKLR
jgi:hypothetical protein